MTVEIPSYGAVDDDGRMVLRGFTSNVTHLMVHGGPMLDYLVIGKWIGPSFWAFDEPIEVDCGVTLKPGSRAVVVMRPPASLTCSRCRRLSREGVW